MGISLLPSAYQAGEHLSGPLMLTNLMGENKAKTKVIAAALKSATARNLWSGDGSGNDVAYSVRSAGGDWNNLLTNARSRFRCDQQETADNEAPGKESTSTAEPSNNHGEAHGSLEPEVVESLSNSTDTRADTGPVTCSASTAQESVVSTEEADQLRSTIKSLQRENTLYETKNDILRQQLLQWQDEAETSRTKLEEARMQYRVLYEEYEKQKEANESLAKSVSLAWQQGYLSGRVAAEDELKQQQLVDSLSRKSSYSTAYDTTNSNATSDTATTAQAEAQPQPKEEQTIFVIADAPLALHDPEVLNDPFTAKLLDALHADGATVGMPFEEPLTAPVNSEDDNTPLTATSGIVYTPAPPSSSGTFELGEPVERLAEPASAPHAQFASTPDSFVDEPAAEPSIPPLSGSQEPIEEDFHVKDSPAESGVAPPPLPLPPAPPLPGANDAAPGPIPPPIPPPLHQAAPPPEPSDEDQPTSVEQSSPSGPAPEPNFQIHEAESELDDQTHNFTAEELHSLFRNRFVREEEENEKKESATTTASSTGTHHTTGTTKKFVGSKHVGSTQSGLPPVSRSFPPEIRKACRLLGLNPEEVTTWTRQVVTDAWKKEMSKPGVHPDTGGDTEMAIYLNTAKDTLMRWVDDQTPKLGKKFGGSSAREKPPTQPNKQD